MTRSTIGLARGLATTLVLLLALALTPAARADVPAPTALPATPSSESEPNETTATANPISSGERMRGNLAATGDVDTYKFSASAGDRVYSAVMTTAGTNAGTADLRLFDPTDTLVELDADDGTFGPTSPTIAGAIIPTSGTYTLQVKSSISTNQVRPYDLYLQLRTGSPAAESEPNDTAPTANALAGGYVSGARDPAAAGEQDWFSFHLDAGDTVFLSLDLDPERDNVTFNGRLRFGMVGNAAAATIDADDPNAGSVGNPPSEAIAMTVRQSGTYYAAVDSANAATGGPTATYRVSSTVLPATQPSCHTYSASSPGPIADLGVTSFSIPVTDDVIIDRAALHLDLTHNFMQDLDASLQTPQGNEIGLFTDVGSASTGVQTAMDVTYDGNATQAPTNLMQVMRPLMLAPEAGYRLDWLEGERSMGTWHVVLRDDASGDTGTLNGAELILCERPAQKPQTTVYSTDFEADDGGFTHSGTMDEWERGLPATLATSGASPVAALSSCASGTSCFKTDLDGIYENSSSQDLLSPAISLVGETGKITAKWQQWFQMESAQFDHLRVSVEEDGGANPRTLYDWTGATMSLGVGNPVVNIGSSAGWGEHRADISDYAGKTIRLRFHVDSDTTVNFAGLAIDDVAVTKRDTAFPVTVTTAGTGTGFVDSSPASIDCGLNNPAKTVCADNFDDGTAVTLTAHPTGGTTFTGFTGSGCSGSGNTCVVTADQARAVTATFAAPPDRTLTVSVTGPGKVTGAGIDCPGDCSQTYAQGTSVQLTATPGASATFSGWASDCAGSSGTGCTLTMSADRTAGASFAAVNAPDCDAEEQALTAAQNRADDAASAQAAAAAKAKRAKAKVKKAKKKLKKADGAKEKKAAKAKVKKAKKKLKKARKALTQARADLTAADTAVTEAMAALDACRAT